jgi:hypothetical protein
MLRLKEENYFYGSDLSDSSEEALPQIDTIGKSLSDYTPAILFVKSMHYFVI